MADMDGESVECTTDEIKTQEEANKPIPEPTLEEAFNVLLGI